MEFVSWSAKYSEVQTLSKDVAEKMAGPMPKIPFGYDLYVKSFFNLCTERQVVQGAILSLPISKIVWYGSYLDITDLDTFVEIIQRMDNEFLKQLEVQRKKSENMLNKVKK